MMLPLAVMLLGGAAAAPVVDDLNPAKAAAEASVTNEATMVEDEEDSDAVPDPLWQTAPTSQDFDEEDDVAVWQTLAKAAIQLKRHGKKAKSRDQEAGNEWSAWKVAKKAAKKIKKASRQMQKGKAGKAKQSARKAARHAATCVRLMELAQQEDATAWPETRDTIQLIESCRAAQVAASTLKKAATDAIKQQRIAAASSAVSSATSPSEHSASFSPQGPATATVSRLVGKGKAAASSDSFSSDAFSKNHKMLMQELKSKVPVYDP